MKRNIDQLVEVLTNEQLLQAYKEIYEWQRVTAVLVNGIVREIHQQYEEFTGNEESLRVTEGAILFEMATRFANLLQKSTNGNESDKVEKNQVIAYSDADSPYVLIESLADRNLKLSELEREKWYYIESDRFQSSEYTGIMLSETDWIHVRYIGQAFTKTFHFSFAYTIASLEVWGITPATDDVWDSNDGTLKVETHTLEWVNEVASTPYTMLMLNEPSCNIKDIALEHPEDKEVYWLSDENIRLDQMLPDDWYYIKVTNTDFIHEITGIKFSYNKIHIQYIGGAYESPYVFSFDFGKEALIASVQEVTLDVDVVEDETPPTLETLRWAEWYSKIAFKFLEDPNKFPKQADSLE